MANQKCPLCGGPLRTNGHSVACPTCGSAYVRDPETALVRYTRVSRAYEAIAEPLTARWWSPDEVTEIGRRLALRRARRILAVTVIGLSVVLVFACVLANIIALAPDLRDSRARIATANAPGREGTVAAQVTNTPPPPAPAAPGATSGPTSTPGRSPLTSPLTTAVSPPTRTPVPPTATRPQPSPTPISEAPAALPPTFTPSPLAPPAATPTPLILTITPTVASGTAETATPTPTVASAATVTNTPAATATAAAATATPTTAPSPTASPTPDALAPPPSPFQGNVILSAVNYLGTPGLNEADEFVVLSNTTGTSISLQGWMIRRRSSLTVQVLPAVTLLPGQSCRIYTGLPPTGTGDCGPLTFGSATPLWGNDQDRLELLDAVARLVSALSYP